MRKSSSSKLNGVKIDDALDTPGEYSVYPSNPQSMRPPVAAARSANERYPSLNTGSAEYRRSPPL